MSANTLKLSAFINPEHSPGDDYAERMVEHVEQVTVARSLGYEGIAIGHHMTFGPSVWLPPMETLCRLAAAAEGMSMATCMLVLPLFHPVHVAQQAAYLDLLTGGRFTLGVAPGWQRDEFAAVGVDHHRRISRFTEAVEVIRRLWSGQPVEFKGRHFQLNGEQLSFVPSATPRPAMWFGGSVPPAVERVGKLAEPRLGDSWVSSSHIVSERIAAQAGLFRATLEARGERMPAEFPVLRNIVVAKDRATALREAGPALERSYRAMGQSGLFTQVVGEQSDRLELERLIAGRVILGSPAEVVDQLGALREAIGYTRLIARVQWMGLEQKVVLRSLELIAEKVAPQI